MLDKRYVAVHSDSLWPTPATPLLHDKQSSRFRRHEGRSVSIAALLVAAEILAGCSAQCPPGTIRDGMSCRRGSGLQGGDSAAADTAGGASGLADVEAPITGTSASVAGTAAVAGITTTGGGGAAAPHTTSGVPNQSAGPVAGQFSGSGQSGSAGKPVTADNIAGASASSGSCTAGESSCVDSPLCQ